MDIDGYEIGERIGYGGMGSVYRAKQTSLGGRTVALKVIHTHLAEDDDFRSRFRTEMKVVSALDHPNVVPVYEAKEVDGKSYIAMALISGEDLGSLIERDAPLDPELAVRIISQIASALDAAHEKGIIHRDVKPANILLDRRVDHAYLSDFGIAKSLEATTALTRTGQGLGSLQYVAPEQFEGAEPDRRSDVYSLGCVLFEALTGATPFKGGTDAFVMKEKLDSAPDRPTEFRPELNSAFDRVSDIALARNPDNRFDSAGELAEAARDALSGEAPTRPLPSSAAEDRTTKLPTTGSRTADPTQVQPQASRATRRFGPAALAAVGVVLLLLTGYALSRSGNGDGGSDNPNEQAGNPTESTAASGSGLDTAGDSDEAASSTTSPISLEPVDTKLFSARVPSGWDHETVDERNSTRFTNEWSDPANPGTSLLIDAQTPAPSGSALESAASVREDTRQSDGYSEVSFREIRMAGRPTAEWIFDVPAEGKKVDYFFSECNVGVAVLGTASVSRFDEMAPTFRRVAASVEPRCQPLTARSPISTEGIGSVLVGMTKSEAEKAGDFELRNVSGPGSCQIFESKSIPDVSFMFTDGILARVGTRNAESQTLSGVGVGDSEAAVNDAYGDQIETEPNFYLPDTASYLTFVPEDSGDNTRVVFDVLEGQVVGIRSGRLPEVGYVEGCS